MTDFQFVSTDVLNNLGSAAVRYKQNLQALKLLRTLKDQGGTPTTAEQTILSRYVGWGSSELINKAFPKSELGEPTKEIEALLSEDEITQLRSSSLSAFFTPLPIIAAVYDVLDYLAAGMSEDQILADFPDLERADIRAALAFAADRERRREADELDPRDRDQTVVERKARQIRGHRADVGAEELVGELLQQDADAERRENRHEHVAVDQAADHQGV